MQRYRGRGGGFAPRRGVGRGRMQEETQTDDEEEVTVENLHIDEVVPVRKKTTLTKLILSDSRINFNFFHS